MEKINISIVSLLQGQVTLLEKGRPFLVGRKGGVGTFEN